jgi:hypothetical protein
MVTDLLQIKLNAMSFSYNLLLIGGLCSKREGVNRVQGKACPTEE